MNTSKIKVLIGIDAGSTHLKTALYTLQGELISIRHSRVNVYHPIPEFSTFRPQEIFHQLCLSLQEQLSDTYFPVAVGISSFGESIVAVDSNGNPLDDMIAWFDMRGEKYIQDFTSKQDILSLFSTSGQVPSGKFTLAKLLWLKELKPELLQKTYCFLFMQDYLSYLLTGQMKTDFSLAARSMLFHIENMCWNTDLIKECGITVSQLPQVIPTGVCAGHITAKASALTGLPAEIPVILAGHDHASASIAAGIIGSDIILDSLGTSETSVFAGDVFQPETLYLHNLCAYPYYNGQYRYLTSIQGCGASIEWLANLLFSDNVFRSFFSHAREASVHFENLPVTLPFLRGLMEVPHVAGCITGLKDIHTKADLCYSLLEGLCFEYKRRILTAEQYIHSSFHKVRAVGRLSKEPIYMQLKANILQKPVEVLSQKEAVSLGAAVLAGKYTGYISEWIPKLETVYMPQEKKQVYELRFQTYLSLLNHLT